MGVSLRVGLCAVSFANRLRFAHVKAFLQKDAASIPHAIAECQ